MAGGWGCSVDQGAVAQAVFGGSQCPIWQCGSNSPEIAGHGFHELHEQGSANAEGFWIEELTKDGVAYGIDVTEGRITGLDADGVAVLTATDLDGAQLLVGHTSGMQYLIRIQDVDSTVPFWAQLPGGVVQPTLESYVLEWAETLDGANPIDPSDWANVCNHAEEDGANPYNLGMHGEHTVVFEGDRIDPALKTVSAALDPTWFNLGCAGHALAKLYLTGHVQAARGEGFNTTTAARQTVLKMLVADYCGTGLPYTVAGVELSWRDRNGWMLHGNAAVTMEARWSAAGAICLDDARIDINGTLESANAFPLGAVGAMQADSCTPPPPCTNSNVNSLGRDYLISGNP